MFTVYVQQHEVKNAVSPTLQSGSDKSTVSSPTRNLSGRDSLERGSARRQLMSPNDDSDSKTKQSVIGGTSPILPSNDVRTASVPPSHKFTGEASPQKSSKDRRSKSPPSTDSDSMEVKRSRKSNTGQKGSDTDESSKQRGTSNENSRVTSPNSFLDFPYCEGSRSDHSLDSNSLGMCADAG